ncbi:MAG: M48 family metallopeptidase [Candidatus Thiodiazotropha sp. (ex. Lucinisca nassula)]|nr:M48 family metallopeptidase [Candidatus Thiodiazotropha sp. (ex. Lucinisca nassula)]MBW9273061.1 M48 family metallopeptidase [Candidatus Thiodiazotropha sp. (ex. Lucinisca nassula)]
MLAAMTDQVHWGRTVIDYEYRFADRKTLAITVHPDLRVTVVAPEGTDLDTIRKKVHKRGAWVRKQQREFELYLPKQPARRFINGESHRYLGRQYRLRAERGGENSVKCLRGYFRITTKDKPNPALAKKHLDRWYRSRADEVFNQRLDVCSERAAREGISRPGLKIRWMQKRWGSCAPEGIIMLNLELIKAPKECIDYVVMHELCHLKEAHHGPKFWSLLKRLMPDYLEKRKKLNIITAG